MDHGAHVWSCGMTCARYPQQHVLVLTTVQSDNASTTKRTIMIPRGARGAPRLDPLRPPQGVWCEAEGPHTGIQNSHYLPASCEVRRYTADKTLKTHIKDLSYFFLSGKYEVPMTVPVTHDTVSQSNGFTSSRLERRAAERCAAGRRVKVEPERAADSRVAISSPLPSLSLYTLPSTPCADVTFPSITELLPRNGKPRMHAQTSNAVDACTVQWIDFRLPAHVSKRRSRLRRSRRHSGRYHGWHD